MHKQVWFTGIILSVIFVSFGIATWGALEKQDRVVTIAGGVIALVTLVTGLLQYDAVRKSLLALLSPSSSSPPQRERLVILAVMGVSAIVGIGFVVSALLPAGKRAIGGTQQPTASPSPTTTQQPTASPSPTTTQQPTASPSTQSSNGIFYTFDDNSQVHDWLTSDSSITRSSLGWDAFSQSAGGSLKVSTYLWGANNPSRPQPQGSQDAYTHTEIVTYFKSPYTYNFSGKKASCWVYVPASMATDLVYVSIFVKSVQGSDSYSNQDGPTAFINDHLDTWFQLSLTIGQPGSGDYVDPQFDPTHIATLGVLIKADDNSTFTGKNIQFYIDDCRIS